jgi:hypothetical protein
MDVVDSCFLLQEKLVEVLGILALLNVDSELLWACPVAIR